MVRLLGMSWILFGILLTRTGFSLAQDVEKLYAEDEGDAFDFRPPPMGKNIESGAMPLEIDSETNFLRPPPIDALEKGMLTISDNANSTEDAIDLKPGHPLERQAGNILACGTRTLARGYYFMQSPNYPKDYPNSYVCSYRLYSPRNNFWRSSVSWTCSNSRFSLESSSGCANDYLQIFGRKYCSTSPPSTARDISYLRATFCTNSAVTSSGFRCLVEARDDGAGSGMACGFHRVQAGRSYTFSSINYPRNYDNYRICRWYFYGASTDQLTLTCSRFSLESHSSCSYDYLYVNGRKYCGQTQPSVTRTRTMYAIFSTDFSVTSTGFTCTVRVASAGCRCGIKNRRARVVGGQNANSGEYPWMAGLVSPGGTRTFCGGSLINDRYVLTAAHCTARRTPSQLQVLLGDHRIGVSDGESRHSVSQIIQHPSYTNYRNGWDFSLVKLSAPVTFTSRRRPVCLPTAGRTYAGVTAIATGFGRLGASQPQANILQEVSLPVITEAACRARWSFINRSHICAGGLPEGGKSVCNGDSGGPLIALESGHYVLIGVVSFGRPCAFPNYPDGYGRVTEALTWIRANTRDATYCT